MEITVDWNMVGAKKVPRLQAEVKDGKYEQCYEENRASFVSESTLNHSTVRKFKAKQIKPLTRLGTIADSLQD